MNRYEHLSITQLIELGLSRDMDDYERAILERLVELDGMILRMKAQEAGYGSRDDIRSADEDLLDRCF